MKYLLLFFFQSKMPLVVLAAVSEKTDVLENILNQGYNVNETDVVSI